MGREGLPVAVIGSGPVGLAAAVHLHEQGLRSVVLEQGRVPAASVAEWAHVRLFSAWHLNVDKASWRLLERHGEWESPDADVHPSGGELRERYLLPLVRALVTDTASEVLLGSRVVSVARLGQGKTQDARESVPFEVVFERAGTQERLTAAAVIDASGSWGSPNPLGVSGLPVPGERELGDRIRYGIPDVLGADRDRYAARRVLVVGSGHSAMNVVTDLARLSADVTGARVWWAVRRPAESILDAEVRADRLPQRTALKRRARELVMTGAVELLAEFDAESLSRSGDSVVVSYDGGNLVVDEIVAATGVRPDLAPLRELRLALDPVYESPVNLAALIDPRMHSCATVPAHGAAELSHPEPDFYLAGMKSYGRAPTFLLVNGYQQVESIAAVLSQGRSTARNVESVPINFAGPSCGPECC